MNNLSYLFSFFLSFSFEVTCLWESSAVKVAKKPLFVDLSIPNELDVAVVS